MVEMASDQTETDILKAATPARPLSPAAERALAEAAQRRAEAKTAAEALAATAPATEIGGRAGPDPVRYGDWEKGGIVSDF
ncbi:MAG: DUF1674 domain-containing protein [Hyphomicrobium sp.]